MASSFFVNPPPDWLNTYVNTITPNVTKFTPKVIARIIDGEQSSDVGTYKTIFEAGYRAYNEPGAEVLSGQLSIAPKLFGTPGDVLTINSQWAYSLNGNSTCQFRLTVNGLNIVSNIPVPNNITNGEVYLSASVVVGEVGQPLFVNGSTRSLSASGNLPETGFDDPLIGVTPFTCNVAANMNFAGLYRHVLTQVTVVRG